MAFWMTWPQYSLPPLRLSDDERLRYWRRVLAEGRRMGDELRELLASGRLAERVQPLWAELQDEPPSRG